MRELLSGIIGGLIGGAVTWLACIALVAIGLSGCVSVSASNHSVGIGWQYYVEPGRPIIHRIPQHLSTRETRRAPLSLRRR